jgi:ATP-dependent DNA ligase
MASKSITIDNTLIAIKNGIIPGCFTPDLKRFIFPSLRYTNEHKDILEWSIEITLKKEDKIVVINDKMLEPLYRFNKPYIAEINIQSNQIGGKIRKTVPTIIKSGKNLGKKNETNVLTQAFRDALSLYNKQIKKTNIGCSDEKPPPMLIQWLNNSKKSILTDDDFKKGITVQRKYNGVRYITFLTINGSIIQYSRTGSDYFPADNLNKELVKLLNTPPSFTLNSYGITTQKELDVYKYSKPYLDGELYIHGKSLSYISGQARKESDKDLLYYYIFDIFFPYAISKGYNMQSKYRQEYLIDLFNNHIFQYIVHVENFKVQNINEINKLANKFIKDGYEGAVARKDEAEYKYSYNNYHSPNVIKIKPVYSDEFKVIDFTQGKKGKDVGKILWICEVSNPKNPTDNTFTVVPNLSLSEREILFTCLSQIVNKNITRFEKYIKGLPLTIEYSELSEKTGKPLQAKAIAFRTYEDKDDPIKKIYKDCGII